MDAQVGYEVSTLRLRRRNCGEDSPRSARDDPNPNPKECAKMKANFPPHGAGAGARRSVVARLMGLDPLPQQQQQQNRSIMSNDSKMYGSSSMTRPQGSYHDSNLYGSSAMMRPQGLYHDKLDNNPISSLSVGDIIRNIGYEGADPLRKSAHHPQEKQLAEFKREFAAKLSTKETLLSPCFFHGEEEQEGHWDCSDASHFMMQTNNKVWGP